MKKLYFEIQTTKEVEVSDAQYKKIMREYKKYGANSSDTLDEIIEEFEEKNHCSIDCCYNEDRDILVDM